MKIRKKKIKQNEISRLRSCSRSKWKGIFLSLFPLKLKSGPHYRKITFVLDSSSTIIKSHIGHFFKLNSGLVFRKKRITKEMVGYKLGEFVLTTKIGTKIHENIKNKKK